MADNNNTLPGGDVVRWGDPSDKLASDRKLRTRISKSMSYYLRHGAEKEGLTIDEGGWVPIDELLAKVSSKRYTVTVEDALYMVETNDKQRYGVKYDADGGLVIRANQGHSLRNVDVELTPITSADEYPVVVHGTFKKSLVAIMEGGLNRMGRNHIHFAMGDIGAREVISGMRRSCEIAIYINLAKCLEDGIVFGVSANGVILTEGIDGVLPSDYFLYIKELKTYEIIWPEDYEEA